MKAYFFIDPGQSGGVAIALGSMDDLAAHNLDGVSSLQELLQDYECYDRRIICENVPSYTGRNIPSHASFKLGRSFGLIEGLARGMNLPCAMIGPKVMAKGSRWTQRQVRYGKEACSQGTRTKTLSVRKSNFTNSRCNSDRSPFFQ